MSEALHPFVAVAHSSPTVETCSIQATLRRAWVWWLMLLVIPFVLFLSLLVYLSLGPVKNPAVGRIFFILSVAWLGIAVPISFFIRARCFRNYWAGGLCKPSDYIRGTLTAWVAIEIGGLISLIGCYYGNSLTPNVLPAVVAFILFTPFWPSGEAMTKALGDEDDPEIMRHPR
jgi:hypothetical protein